MKKLCVILLLVFCTNCAHIVHHDSYGPEPWKHSTDYTECQIKSFIWFSLGSVALIYFLHRAQDKHRKDKEDKKEWKQNQHTSPRP